MIKYGYSDLFTKRAPSLIIQLQPSKMTFKQFNFFKKQILLFKVQDQKNFKRMVRIYQSVKLLTVQLSTQLFYQSYTIRAVIKKEEI